jgi:hypothetical protein
MNEEQAMWKVGMKNFIQIIVHLVLAAGVVIFGGNNSSPAEATALLAGVVLFLGLEAIRLVRMSMNKNLKLNILKSIEYQRKKLKEEQGIEK